MFPFLFSVFGFVKKTIAFYVPICYTETNMITGGILWVFCIFWNPSVFRG